MMRIMSVPISFMLTAALAFCGCANDGGQSAQKPTQEPAQAAQVAQVSAAQVGADTGAKEKPAGKNAGDGVIEIKEKMFIAQTNEIYINTKDYLGKTVKYEGIFHEVKADGKTYRYVIRYGPGCCPGDVSAAGFEVAWDKPYPKHNDWVEVAGVLEKYDDNGIPALRLALKSLTVKTKRGAERVMR